MSLNTPSDQLKPNTNRSGSHSLIQPQYMYHRFLAFLRTFFRAAYYSVQLPNSGMGYADNIVPLSTVFPGLYLFEINNLASFPPQRIQNPAKAMNALVPSAMKQDGDELLKDTITPTVSATSFPNAHDLRFEGNPQFHTNSVNTNVRNEHHRSFIYIRDSPLSFLTVIIVIAFVSLIMIPGNQRLPPTNTDVTGAQSFSQADTPAPYAGGRDGSYGTSVLRDRLEPFISHAAINASIEQPHREVYPGTRKRAINEIKAWIDDPSALERILWLYGPAGAGKSAIVQEIVNSYTEEKMPATFFFYRSDSNRNDGNRLFTTLAWRFAISVSRVRSHIVHSLNKDPDLGRKNVETQFRQLIARPFETLSNSMGQTKLSDMVVVIDGIDECVDPHLQERILKVIGSVATNTRLPLRFFIASRPEANINETMNPFRHHTLSIDLAAYTDADHDIEIYLQGKFYDIAIKHHIDPAVWPGERNISDLVSKASGQFIYASTVIKFVDEDDNAAQNQLDMILDLEPHTMQPFAELDRLYIEVLERQPDKEFLKTFLALLSVPSIVLTDLTSPYPSSSAFGEVGLPGTAPFHIPSNPCYGGNFMYGRGHYNQGYASLMNMPEEELFRKLRKMRSLLQFDPDNVFPYHQSFLDFLQDPLRSGKYNIRKESAIKQYFERAIHSLIKSASLVIEQPQADRHPPIPEFIEITGMMLSTKDSQASIRPLLKFQDQLLNFPNFTILRNECTIFHIVHKLLLHCSCTLHILCTLERNYDGAYVPSALTKHCLEPLVTDFESSKDMFNLNDLHTDPEVIAMRVTSWSEAQNMIELVDRIVKGEYSSTIPYNADVARNAALLALKIYTRVPVLPQSFFSTKDFLLLVWNTDAESWTTVWIFSNFLDHQYILPMSDGKGIFDDANKITIPITVDDGIPMSYIQKSESHYAIISAILSLARSIQYLHSMDIVLSDDVGPDVIHVDWRFRARIPATGLMWWIPDHSLHQRYESDISKFGYIFLSMYSDKKELFTTSSTTSLNDLDFKIPEEVWHLIQRCISDNGKPTIDEVVQEMESWKLDPDEVAKEMESWKVVSGDIFQRHYIEHLTPDSMKEASSTII